MCTILSGNTVAEARSKHALETRSQSSLRFIAPGESFTVELVATKHFASESLHVEPSCGLDIVVYMLKCMFC